MTKRLADKTAFVTAAGQGIGRAICESFAAEGARVIATDLDPKKLAGLDAVRTGALNVLSTPDVEAFAAEVVKAFGAPDILVNCAGFVHHGDALHCSEADWDFSFDLNVKSIHRILRAFLPGMLQNGRGSIVNVSSAVSSITGVPNRYVYGATKAAIIGLTKAVAADYIRQGIRCNAVCPGTIETPSLDGRVEDLSRATGRSLGDVRQAFIDRQPMGRLGTAREVAALALFLASDEASYITGQAHLVDGGMAL
jgi:2-keto-3-deoxy-L-fuconate dehydrogenase